MHSRLMSAFGLPDRLAHSFSGSALGTSSATEHSGATCLAGLSDQHGPGQPSYSLCIVYFSEYHDEHRKLSQGIGPSNSS